MDTFKEVATGSLHPYDNFEVNSGWVFLFQALSLPSFLFITYVLHLLFKSGPRENRMEALKKLDYSGKVRSHRDYEEFFESRAYNEIHYLAPLFFCYIVNFLSFSITHPYILSKGYHKGILETTIDVYAAGSTLPRALLLGRVLFWGWLGAYIYSFSLCFDRLMNSDLSPKVYIYCCKRFLLALVVGSAVTVSLGTMERATGITLDVALANSALVSFFLGFFPDRGLDFIIVTAYSLLRIAKPREMGEMSLGEIEGMNIWQQGRLNQEGIENLQNLASCDIDQLIIRTSFPATTIVDWIDQAIFKSLASQEQEQALKKAGIVSASALMTLAVIDKSFLVPEQARPISTPSTPATSNIIGAPSGLVSVPPPLESTSESVSLSSSSSAFTSTVTSTSWLVGSRDAIPERLIKQLSGGVELSEGLIAVLIHAIQNHPNFKRIAHYRWRKSYNSALVAEALQIRKMDKKNKEEFKKLKAETPEQKKNREEKEKRKREAHIKAASNNNQPKQCNLL